MHYEAQTLTHNTMTGFGSDEDQDHAQPPLDDLEHQNIRDAYDHARFNLNLGKSMAICESTRGTCSSCAHEYVPAL